MIRLVLTFIIFAIGPVSAFAALTSVSIEVAYGTDFTSLPSQGNIAFQNGVGVPDANAGFSPLGGSSIVDYYFTSNTSYTADTTPPPPISVDAVGVGSTVEFAGSNPTPPQRATWDSFDSAVGIYNTTDVNQGLASDIQVDVSDTSSVIDIIGVTPPQSTTGDFLQIRITSVGPESFDSSVSPTVISNDLVGTFDAPSTPVSPVFDISNNNNSVLLITLRAPDLNNQLILNQGGVLSIGFTETNSSAIPLPSSFLFWILGLGSLWWIRPKTCI